MATLLLCCMAPIQSWGTQSHFSIRDTGREPSKSGIVGLLCAALGRSRSEPVKDLASLKMGVRVDREGRLLRDFHTAGKEGFLRASGSIESENVILTHRYYLTDAAFLIGLESPDLDWLTTLSHALHSPRWMLCLGRKACVPSQPVWLKDGLRPDQTLCDALETYPWLGKNEDEYHKLSPLRLVYDDPENGIEVRHDYPLSFAKGNRQFIPRRVTTTFLLQNPRFLKNPF